MAEQTVSTEFGKETYTSSKKEWLANFVSVMRTLKLYAPKHPMVRDEMHQLWEKTRKLQDFARGKIFLSHFKDRLLINRVWIETTIPSFAEFADDLSRSSLTTATTKKKPSATQSRKARVRLQTDSNTAQDRGPRGAYPIPSPQPSRPSRIPRNTPPHLPTAK